MRGLRSSSLAVLGGQKDPGPMETHPSVTGALGVQLCLWSGQAALTLPTADGSLLPALPAGPPHIRRFWGFRRDIFGEL